MKLKFSKEITHARKALEKEIAVKTARFEKAAIYEGQSFAFKNLPAANEPTAEPFYTTTRGQYSTLVNDVGVHFKGNLQKMLAAANIKFLDEKIASIIGAIEIENKKQKEWLKDIKRLEIYGKNISYKTRKHVLLLFALADSLFMMSSFLKMGDIVIVSAIVGILIGLAQVFACKGIVQNIREIDNPKQQRKYSLFIIIGFSAFSLLLGAFRYAIAIQTMTKPPSLIFFNPFFFAAINMVLLAASAATVLFYFPTKKEIAELDLIDELERKIKHSKAQQNDLSKEKDNVQKQKQEAIEFHGQMIIEEQKLMSKVSAQYDVAVGMLQSENINRRTDNIFPTCFKIRHLPLTHSPNNAFNDQINQS